MMYPSKRPELLGWRRSRINWIVPAMALLVMAIILSGCANLIVPPGFARQGGMVKVADLAEATPEAAYALLHWYELATSEMELPEEWRQQVAWQKDLAAMAVYQQWASKLVEKGQPVVSWNNQQTLELMPKHLGKQGELEEELQTLAEVKWQLEQPLEILVPANECLQQIAWPTKNSKIKEDFAAWAKERKLLVPDPKVFLRQNLLQTIERLEKLLQQKLLLTNAMTEAEKLAGEVEDGELKALDLLTESRKKLPDELDWSEIAGQQTLADFAALLQKWPEKHLQRELTAIAEALDSEEKRLGEESNAPEGGWLAAYARREQRFSESLRAWRQDERFAQSLQQQQEKINSLTGRCAELRLQVSRAQLQLLTEQREYWEAEEQFKTWRNFLREQADADLELYQAMAPVSNGNGEMSYRRQIELALQEEYLAMLPKAMVEYQGLAERALNISNKYGLAMALCVMLKQMTAPGGELALPETMQEACRKTDLLLAKAKELAEEKNILRTVTIDDMSSATAGVGMTYSRDLENELRSLLTSFGLLRLVRVADTGGSKTPWSYVVHGGVVANFDGSESSSRQTMRTISRHGETRRRPNPNYHPDQAGQSLAREHLSPFFYTQDILEQVIHVKEIERLAHVRVFMHMRGPGVSTLIEVNEFYTRKFVLEESHPFNDVRVSEVVTVYDATELHAAEAAPTLRYDRVWTPGEILDWARRDSLRMVAMQLLYHINQYPLYLAQRAERLAFDGEVTEAAEQWGNCFVLCQSLDTETELEALLKTTTPPAAAAYDACLANMNQQRQSLQDLKKSIRNKMLQQTNEYLRRQKLQAKPSAVSTETK